MFARMVFNVLAHNRDDHAKQHAFLLGRNGRWTLAPAFDLTFSHGPGGDQYLAVDGIGRDIARARVSRLARTHDVAVARERAIVDRVANAVADFATFASRYGVSSATVSVVEKGLARTREAFARAS